MSERIIQPQYLRIALDIASRVTRGELQENSKVYGRSVMASEYGVSPETIRRALKLLSDMQVVEIKPQSGVYILSADNAQKYIERFGKRVDLGQLQNQLKNMIAQHNELSRKISDTAAVISKIEESASIAAPFTNYEVKIEENSRVCGKNIGELQFWQATGATIIAIRREDNIILSPGPYAQLLAGDTVVFVGDLAAAEAAEKYIRETE
ncbi:TrkA C-terminal domain-containing protein [Candidatus Soleaferrea massiliensis]|uniref:TrkA C-terminal domain-containing protein n=1 Tax=Candidatus Soleaferrea massiliensis TaxID=1470354 RepID=UPI00058DACD9|nr:TrkA C-terminal domain-containing protein [Candidatus Soleaferrea massiliensis]